MGSNKICFSKKKVIIVFLILFSLGIFVLISQFESNRQTLTSKASSPNININPVIGGNIARDGEFPFFTSLISTTGFNYCGGALISEEWVISAASCISDIMEFDPVAYRDYVKEENTYTYTTSDDNSGDPTLKVFIGINRYDYDKELKAFHYTTIDKIIVNDDMALIHLIDKAVNIPTLSLYNPGKGKYLETLYVDVERQPLGMGFGATEYDAESKSFSNYSSELKTLDLIIDKKEVLNFDKRFITLPSKKLSERIAAVDKGGPVILPVNNRTYLLGVIFSSDLSTNYAVSASHYYSWINTVIRLKQAQKPNTAIIPNPKQKPITICTEKKDIVVCSGVLYDLCSWVGDQISGSCINDPKQYSTPNN